MPSPPEPLRVDAEGIDPDRHPTLHAALEEAEEAIEHNPEWNAGRISDYVAKEQMRTISARDNVDLEVLKELRDHDAVDAGELEMYQNMASAYDHADATIEAIVHRSIKMFVWGRVSTDNEPATTAEEARA